MTSIPPMNVTAAPMHTESTVIGVTTAAPMHTESTVIGVVITLLLITLAVVAFLLYRYLCHNKGDYRTTGEPAPGEELTDDYKQATDEKKEYFI